MELRDNDKTKSFCVTAIRRPSVIKGMRKLVLIMPSQVNLDPNDLSRITKMLHLSVNL